MTLREENLAKEVKKLERINEYLKIQTTHWCPIVSSKEIKFAIINRINDLGVSPYEVAIRADVSFNSFKKYYLEYDSPLSRSSLRPEDLMKIGKLIGIKIKTLVVMTKTENIDRTKLLNDHYIPQSKRKRNKKV